MATLWQECIAFLSSAQLISENAVMESLDQLAFLLSDGVILCKLANFLRPESVEENKVFKRNSWNQRSNFKSCSNISLFLTACRQFFGVPNHYIFNVEDLSELQNFDRVLKLLSYLSSTDLARNKGLRSFSVTHTNSVEYINLPEIVEEHLDEYIQLTDAIYETENRENEHLELATGHPVEYTEIICGTPPNDYIDSIPSNENDRNHCLQDLINFEYKHLTKLKQLVLHSEQLVRDQKVTRADNKRLFYSIAEMVQVHEKLYEDLSKVVEFILNNDSGYGADSNLMTFDGIFLKHKIDLAEVYKHRLMGLEDSIGMLKLLMRVNSSVKERLDFGLTSVLDSPQKQICGYKLILEKLEKKTQNDEPLCNDVKIALNVMDDICKFLNKIYNRIEEINGFAEYLYDFPKPKMSLSNYGKLLSDEPIEIIRTTMHENATKSEKAHYFLFDAVIILCKQTKDGFKFLEEHELKDFQITMVKNMDKHFLLENPANGRIIHFIFRSRKKCERIFKIFWNILSNLKQNELNVHSLIIEMTKKVFECKSCSKLSDVIAYICQVCQNTFDCECHKYYPCCQTSSQNAIKNNDFLQVLETERDGTFVAKVFKEDGSTKNVRLNFVNEVNEYMNDVFSNDSADIILFSQTNRLTSSCVLDGYYENPDIESKIFYFGTIDKDQANQLLGNTPSGTFLLRYSTTQLRYVVSINIFQMLIHIKLGYRIDGQNPSISIGNSRFNTINDFISHYRRTSLDTIEDLQRLGPNAFLKSALIKNTLQANFVMLGTNERGNVRIKPSDIIHVTSTENEESGFWQVCVKNEQMRLSWAMLLEYATRVNQEFALTTSSRNRIRSSDTL